MKLFILFASLFLASDIVYSQNFSYEDQDNWPGLCKTGKRQSPINIKTDKVEKKRMLLQFNGNDNKLCANVSDTGHYVQIKFRAAENNSPIPTISGDDMDGTYFLASIFLHWKSEHTINGKRFPMETHIMYLATKYSFDQAFHEKDGTVGLSVLSKLAKDKSIRKFDQITSNLPTTPDAEPIRVCGIDLNMFLPKNRKEFYRYNGSTPNPDCIENVMWTVFKEITKIAKPELCKISRIKDASGKVIKNNFRKTQPLNHRKVYYSN